MNKTDIQKVVDIIEERGDSFWSYDNGDGVSQSNAHLLDEIVSLANQAGYDLKLVKKED